MKNIAVLSAGNGGQALAADLTLRGHAVRLYELPRFSANLDAIGKKGGCIRLENKITGEARIACLTTDMGEAVRGADVVYFTAPSYGQQEFFELLVPALEDGQVVVLMPGNYGTFALKNMLTAAGKDVCVAETDNLPYACAITEQGCVNVRGVKKTVMLASFPASDYGRVEAAIKDAFCTGWRAGAHVLANAARIENTGGAFEFYYAGMTPSVCRLIEATDAERLAVAKAYGLELVSSAQTFRTQYGVEGETLYDVLQANAAFAGAAPGKLDHRFLTEDTPYSMVPMAALGKLAGVPTPVMDALVTLISSLMNEDYASTGQSLERMGLAGMSSVDVLRMASA